MAPTRVRRPNATVLAALAVAGLLAFVVPSFASDRGVSPPEGCTCHSDNPSATVQVTVDGWPPVYTPGESYPLTVTAIGEVPSNEGGFSVEVTKGSLSSGDPLVVASGRYATHTGAGERVWPLVWLAPAEDSGGVTLTVYVNLVNGDGAEGPEDLWNVATLGAVEKAPEPPKPSHLHLSVEAPGQPDGEPIAGPNFTVLATLTNFTDAPIPNAVITYSAHLSFGVLPMGTSRTDANGTARINWSVVSQGEFLLLANYDGSARNESSNASAVVAIGDPERVFESYYGEAPARRAGFLDPIRLPLALIVGGVWVTFAFAGVLVVRLRKLGSPAGDGPRDLLKLVLRREGDSGRERP